MSATGRDDADRPGRLRRLLDPVVVGGSSFVVIALHGYQSGLTADMATFLYGGERLVHGTPPYQGVFNSVGPLADAVPGLAIALGKVAGVDPVLSTRLLFTGLSALCCALVCVLGRDLFDSRAAGYVAGAALLVDEKFLQLGSGGPREKTTMLVFLVAVLLLLVRQRWGAAGVATALATLTWQPAFAPAVTAILVAALLAPGPRRLRVLARFVVGGLATSGVTLAYFAAVDGLRQAVDGFIVVNARYTSQPSPVLAPGRTLHTFLRTYGPSFVLVVVGLVALVVLGLRSWRPARRAHDEHAGRRVVVAVGGVAAVGWTLAVANGPADLFVVLPFGAIGLAGLVALATSRLGRPLWTAAVSAGLVAVLVGYAVVTAVTTRDSVLVTQRADVRAVLATQPPDAMVMSLNAPQALVLGHRTNPTPYQLFTPAMNGYLDGEYPGGLAAYARRARALHPTFVVVGTFFSVPWAEPMLSADYRRIGKDSHWIWYLRRSAGPEALARAKAAHARAMVGAGARR